MTLTLALQTTTHLFATSATQDAAQRFSASWPWYVVRAAGFVAAGLLILLMLSGIGQVTGLTYRLIEPVKAWALHKALAFALVASIAMHVIFLLIDKYLPFTIPQVLVPFLDHYNNNVPLFGMTLGIIAVGLGILAMYGVLIIVASSLGWIDTKKGLWRKLHYLGYVVMLFVFVHALGAGSDLKYGTFRAGWIMLGLIILLAVATRLWRAGTLKKHHDIDK
jgi:sulfoxide reductase heme-binding subunit YedZ